MAMSGVKLTESCMTSYTDIQKGKKNRYAIFLIKDGQIDVEKVSAIIKIRYCILSLGNINL